MLIAIRIHGKWILAWQGIYSSSLAVSQTPANILNPPPEERVFSAEDLVTEWPSHY